MAYHKEIHGSINLDTVYFEKGKGFILGDPWISGLSEQHEQYHSP